MMEIYILLLPTLTFSAAVSGGATMVEVSTQSDNPIAGEKRKHSSSADDRHHMQDFDEELMALCQNVDVPTIEQLLEMEEKSDDRPNDNNNIANLTYFQLKNYTDHLFGTFYPQKEEKKIGEGNQSPTSVLEPMKSPIRGKERLLYEKENYHYNDDMDILLTQRQIPMMQEIPKFQEIKKQNILRPEPPMVIDLEKENSINETPMLRKMSSKSTNDIIKQFPTDKLHLLEPNNDTKIFENMKLRKNQLGVTGPIPKENLNIQGNRESDKGKSIMNANQGSDQRINMVIDIADEELKKQENLNGSSIDENLQKSNIEQNHDQESDADQCKIDQLLEVFKFQRLRRWNFIEELIEKWKNDQIGQNLEETLKRKRKLQEKNQLMHIGLILDTAAMSLDISLLPIPDVKFCYESRVFGIDNIRHILCHLINSEPVDKTLYRFMRMIRKSLAKDPTFNVLASSQLIAKMQSFVHNADRCVSSRELSNLKMFYQIYKTIHQNLAHRYIEDAIDESRGLRSAYVEMFLFIKDFLQELKEYWQLAVQEGISKLRQEKCVEK